MSQRVAVPPYLTKDGSEVRELMHPAVQGNMAQSLAEATVPAGHSTLRHCHHRSEELYCFIGGAGMMHLADETFAVVQGDTVCIPPGVPHFVQNTGSEPLVVLCICSPPYSHEDTELLSDPGDSSNYA